MRVTHIGCINFEYDKYNDNYDTVLCNIDLDNEADILVINRVTGVVSIKMLQILSKFIHRYNTVIIGNCEDIITSHFCLQNNVMGNIECTQIISDDSITLVLNNNDISFVYDDSNSDMYMQGNLFQNIYYESTIKTYGVYDCVLNKYFTFNTVPKYGLTLVEFGNTKEIKINGKQLKQSHIKLLIEPEYMCNIANIIEKLKQSTNILEFSYFITSKVSNRKDYTICIDNIHNFIVHKNKVTVLYKVKKYTNSVPTDLFKCHPSLWLIDNSPNIIQLINLPDQIQKKLDNLAIIECGPDDELFLEPDEGTTLTTSESIRNKLESTDELTHDDKTYLKNLFAILHDNDISLDTIREERYDTYCKYIYKQVEEVIRNVDITILENNINAYMANYCKDIYVKFDQFLRLNAYTKKDNIKINLIGQDIIIVKVLAVSALNLLNKRVILGNVVVNYAFDCINEVTISHLLTKLKLAFNSILIYTSSETFASNLKSNMVY